MEPVYANVGKSVKIIEQKTVGNKLRLFSDTTHEIKYLRVCTKYYFDGPLKVYGELRKMRRLIEFQSNRYVIFI